MEKKRRKWLLFIATILGFMFGVTMVTTAISGGGIIGQVAYWNSTESIGGNTNLTYNETTSHMNINGTLSINDSLVCTADGNNCPATGADQNNYTTAISFSGTTTKTLHVARNGMVNLTSSFTDQTIGNCSGLNSCDEVFYPNGENLSVSLPFWIGPEGTAIATGANAFAINGNASGTSSLAIGGGSKASATGSVAIGLTAIANGTNYAVAIGRQAQAGFNSATGSPVAIGDTAKSTNLDSVAIGASSSATGNRAIAIGSSSVSSGTNCLALSGQSTCTHTSSVAIGRQAATSSNNQVAIGGGATTYQLWIDNHIILNGVATAPSTSDGTIYYDTTGSHALCARVNGAWTVLAGAGSCA